MVTVTSRRAPAKGKTAKVRTDLAKELLTLTKKLKPETDRMTAIEDELKKSATDGKESFIEVVDKLGKVTVAPGYTGEFKGNVPMIQTEAWLALKPAERKRLEKDGLVKTEPQWGKNSSGRVTVKLAGAA
jgi:hypothetical protein